MEKERVCMCKEGTNFQFLHVLGSLHLILVSLYFYPQTSSQSTREHSHQMPQRRQQNSIQTTPEKLDERYVIFFYLFLRTFIFHI